MNVAFGWIAILAHRTALASFVCGGWGLGQYSANYFAKNLLPRSPHKRATLTPEGIDPDCIWLSCWIWRDKAVMEDAAHVIMECPSYA